MKTPPLSLPLPKRRKMPLQRFWLLRAHRRYRRRCPPLHPPLERRHARRSSPIQAPEKGEGGGCDIPIVRQGEGPVGTPGGLDPLPDRRRPPGLHDRGVRPGRVQPGCGRPVERSPGSPVSTVSTLTTAAIRLAIGERCSRQSGPRPSWLCCTTGRRRRRRR